MRQLIKKYLRRKDGAIAVETAIITPILVFMIIPAIDLGLQIYTMQKMKKATDSGVEYLVNGGRTEGILRNIVQDSFGDQISQSDLSVLAYCACISSGDNGGNNSGEGSENPDPSAGFYVKTTTSLAEDMCMITCDDGTMPSALVNVNLNRQVKGIWKDKWISSHLQTRVR